MDLAKIIRDWNEGRYGSLSTAYAENPEFFRGCPKAAEHEWLYRGRLISIREFENLIRTGRIVDYGRLEAWCTHDGVPTPIKFSPYLLEVVFKRRVPLEDRILRVAKDRVVCVTQTVRSDDVWAVGNRYKNFEPGEFQEFLAELRHRKIVTAAA